ncbi:aminotransferase-like domain-containing protein [Nocardioides daeguensis]|uniref:PLP-dependent aminotransferase family protein n=1 Tax=Nocardioides daeguensis TaxID=908359 RepID=A0ABP6WBC1_9ACTN|nr:PLP-dependent aminotransferase family protein [Nocardioides daeguensis]MBV6729342.1 PLP-dependent aminotransferase family protein [Nocardioides daeguensis]MCR1774318.1 PLP-dependent aminotransferase family protein [Nocardioides daeguensis]
MNNDSSARIVAGLRAWIRDAAAGAQLPSSRRLVAEYGASPVTVQKALRRLVAEGLVESRPGVGTFVCAARPARGRDFGWQSAALRSPRADLARVTGLRTPPPGVQALHDGYPGPDLLPERLVRTALGRAARGAAATSRPSAAGLPELRAWFATELADATPAHLGVVTPNDVVVTPGSQSALASIFRALVAPGQPLLIESPTYWGAIQAARQADVEPVPVPSDGQGPDPAEVDRALRETGARAFYAQPSFANPTGAHWSLERGSEVLEVVRAHGAFLVEDDWAHDFGIDADLRPVAARDDAGHVVYVRSLTKSVSPAIRVAAVIARGPARDRILADRAAESMYVSGLLQQAALEVVSDPAWRTHLRRLRGQLRERRDLLVAAVAEHAPSLTVDVVPPGGLHLWARLPDGTDGEQVVRDCAADGVWVAAGDEWFPAEPTAAYLRLTFIGPEPGGYPAAARVIERAVARQGRRT